MIYGMRTNLHATRQHFPKLAPIHIALPADLPGNDIEHATEAMGAKKWKGKVVRIVIAIVEGEDNRMQRERPIVIEGIEQLIKGDRVVAMLLEVIQLLAESCWSDCETQVKEVFGWDIRNMMIHQNGNLHYTGKRLQWWQDRSFRVGGAAVEDEPVGRGPG